MHMYMKFNLKKKSNLIWLRDKYLAYSSLVSLVHLIAQIAKEMTMGRRKPIGTSIIHLSVIAYGAQFESSLGSTVRLFVRNKTKQKHSN